MPDAIVAGRYRLDELLGRSGMSDVWRAQDLELERPVALKLLAPGSDRARFDREARALASLTHPNIGQLFDYGETEGRPFLVLEYLPGGTLEQRLSAGRPLPDAETRAIAAGIAAGLEHAHARGIVHRDLKPANVIFDDEGRPKLVDFGIARSSQHEGSITEPGTVMGTAAYMAPEQAAAGEVGPPADVYAFGAILYRMLTGRPPFSADDPLELLRLHQTAEPAPISSFRRDAPPELASAALSALAKDPRARPADGAALAALLEGAPETRVMAAAPPPGSEPTLVLRRGVPPPRPGRRSRLPLALAAMVVLALAGAAVAYEVTRSTGSKAPPVSPPSSPVRTGPSTRPAPPPPTAPATTTSASTRPTSTPATTAPTTTAPPPPTTTAPPPTTEATTATTTTATTTTTPPTTTSQSTTEPGGGTGT
jgi:serine/threonine protein kinase